jgi:hypothetical protein
MKQFNYAARLGILALPSALILVLLAAGCSNTGVKNKLGRVSGTVTLAGAPLPNALVMFSGIQGGSPSAGRTDASGNYTLVFSRGINGAEVGSHTVTISTYQPATDDPPAPETPEKVPLKYRDPDSKDALKAEVKAGSNKIDFALEAGPIEAPKEKGKKGPIKGPIVCY